MFFEGWRTVRVYDAPLCGTGMGMWVVATITMEELALDVDTGVREVAVALPTAEVTSTEPVAV